VSVVIMMGLAARGTLADALLGHGWAPDTCAAIVCDASTPAEWIWTGTLSALGAATPPVGAAGVLVFGDVVKVRGALGAAARPRAGADDDRQGVTHGRNR
jgi:siroheme synthase